MAYTPARANCSVASPPHWLSSVHMFRWRATRPRPRTKRYSSSGRRMTCPPARVYRRPQFDSAIRSASLSDTASGLARKLRMTLPLIHFAYSAWAPIRPSEIMVASSSSFTASPATNFQYHPPGGSAYPQQLAGIGIDSILSNVKSTVMVTLSGTARTPATTGGDTPTSDISMVVVAVPVNRSTLSVAVTSHTISRVVSLIVKSPNS